ncbi:DedA family protein [Marinilabiliaceae bacterium ANBcel2]|nr:DedA family protein [Marinilabiliaceae bacterium ANBcel2]
MIEETGYIALFIGSFLTATILPFPLSSEALLSAMIVSGYNFWLTILTATVANWLGGVTCFWLGRQGKWDWIEKYMRIPKSKIEWLHKKIVGKEGWAAIFTWLPAIGDPLAVVLGFMKARVLPTIFWIFVGKGLRYVVWSYITIKTMEAVT